jgi:hypothetical protein
MGIYGEYTYLPISPYICSHYTSTSERYEQHISIIMSTVTQRKISHTTMRQQANHVQTGRAAENRDCAAEEHCECDTERPENS